MLSLGRALVGLDLEKVRYVYDPDKKQLATCHKWVEISQWKVPPQWPDDMSLGPRLMDVLRNTFATAPHTC